MRVAFRVGWWKPWKRRWLRRATGEQLGDALADLVVVAYEMQEAGVGVSAEDWARMAPASREAWGHVHRMRKADEVSWEFLKSVDPKYLADRAGFLDPELRTEFALNFLT